MIRLLMFVLALVVAAPVATAQPAPAPADRREAIKKKIRALRAYALTEELKLDEKTAAKLFPLLAKWDDVTDKLLGQRVDLTRQLRAAEQVRDPRTLDKLLDDTIANQRAFWDLEDKRLAELRKILTPAQTARILVVLPEFERKIQNRLRRAIQRQAGQPGAAAGSRRQQADPDDDEDEEDDRGAPAPTSRRPNRRGP